MTRTQQSRRRRVRPRLDPSTLTAAAPPDTDLVDEALWERRSFAGVNFAARAARLVDVEECRFTDTTWSGCDVEKLTMSDSVLDRCDLANATLDHLSLQRVEVTGCRMTGLAVPAATVRHVLFRGCIGDLSAWRFVTCVRAEFVECRLQRADFGSADLRGATFRRCDLTDAELSGARATGAVFVDCTWDGIRGVSSLAGATVVHASPVDALTFTGAMATGLGIALGDPADYPED